MVNIFFAALCLSAQVAVGHTVISYPGWRGNNLIVNEEFPFGMQWMYPCGGLSVATNRTYWPTKGGAVAVQPGWFTGHKSALMYINLGLGAQPQNYSWQMVPMFEVQGPTDDPYPGTFCLPQVPLPAGQTPKDGDLATIQVVEAAKHGAALFSCVDIIFTDDPSKLPPLNTTNCFNSTSLRISAVKVVDAELAVPSSSPVTLSPSSSSSAALSQSPATQSSQTPAANAASGAQSRFSALMSLLLLV
ncbi:hypothetical protein GQ53DRAFT_752957 [Thozetella sp. PMI_491]|nr:hypothetical protein GQ53DRAFT_752957 [Thozetella sp. PMI_491]